ncbi:INGRESSION PROTEIN FIC1 [Salix purpurea]|uniref:INGRESSION PROTEIN FIC1 n=1 Tax=Salix purpurea TaxID=77065 RepID=A0A9Q0WB85_SALPP|nr:INGRESSION PROTEIN FIC1 [Salix purpurea]
MDSGSMEIKVMYCKDVSSFNFFQKLLVYVLVSIVRNDGDPDKKPLELQKQQRRTPTDKEAEGDPEWNHPMHFDLSEVSFQDRDNLFIHFDLCHEGLYFGDKIIGEVRVPLKDLIQEANGIARFVSYEVRTPDGKPNGMLNFSCKVKNMGANSSQTGITGYPIVNHQPYPTSEVQSLPEQVHYPTLDLEANAPETRTVSQVPYTSDWTQYSSQENYYPPPEAYYHPPPPPPEACYHPPPPPPEACCHPPPPPPPPPPEACCHPPPPPPMVDGAWGCYGPPRPPPLQTRPPPLHPWPPGANNYSSRGNWGPMARQLPTFADEEMRANDFRLGRAHRPSFLNGR